MNYLKLNLIKLTSYMIVLGYSDFYEVIIN